jgi:hypothetical protein
MKDHFELGELLWKARLRFAWGSHADVMIARDPWPPHRAHPSLTTAHELAIAEAQALLADFTLTERKAA